MPAELSSLTHAPDCIHVVKTMKENFANWYRILDDQRCNLSLLRTLRGDTVFGPLRKLLPLDVVRHKGRMNSEAPRLLSQKKVLTLLEGVDWLVHPFMPERWRVFDENKEWVIKTPIAICNGAKSQLLVLDNYKYVVYALGLHYPAHKSLTNVHKDGIMFIGSESGIYYVDHGNVLKVKSNYDI